MDHHKQIVYHLRKALEPSLELAIKPASKETEMSQAYLEVTRTIENLLEYLALLKEGLLSE